MKIDEWHKIESIFHLALELEGAARENYLARACAEQPALRGEVESLLGSFERKNHFLDEPAFDLGLQVLQAEPEISLTGETIGVYRVLEKIGAGGMGDVYLAEDTRLNRRVALKFLSRGLINDQWARRQLIKEAQAVAMLDHPNICPVYGFEELDGHQFIVMQYIEGATLSDMLRRDGRIDEGFAVTVINAVAGAIAAAHAQGVIHRDLKAGNIMVTPGGQVKVLDFGLAKIIARRPANETPGESTLASQNGLIVGTVAYMSPEQLRAEKLDYRTDVFSLGILFYELIAGRHPFLRNSDADTISTILNVEPPPLAAPPDSVVGRIAPVVLRCLAKNRSERYGSAHELLLELHSEPAARPLKAGRAAARRWLNLFGFLLLAVMIGLLLYRPATRPRTLAVLQFVNQTGEAQHDYLSGIAETLIHRISNSSPIAVKPSTPVARARSDQADPVAIGRELGVDAVLNGVIKRGDGRLLLETQLINVYDGNVLFRETGELNESTALSLQDELVAQIVAKLQSPVSAKAPAAKAKDFTRHPEANRFYLQGLDYWKNRNAENIFKARESFRQAIRLDPQFALAYAYLAQVYLVRPSSHYRPLNPQDARELALKYARDAIALDENLSEAHAALGAVYHKYEWNWTEAEKEYRRSLELNPQVAQTYYWYSELLLITGRTEEAIRQSRRAGELDPYSPLMQMQIGRMLYYAGRYGEAERFLKEALVRHRNDASLKMMLGFVYLEIGRPAEAVRLLEEVYAVNKTAYAASLGYAYGKAGRRADALRILDELTEIEKSNEFFSVHEKALVFLGIDDREQAFYWLEKAFEEPFGGLTVLGVNPIYRNLRADPRFHEMLRRLNLDPIS